MPYTLYIDKDEEFVCEVAVKNASLKNAFARMIVEASDLTLMFEGKLKDGKCTVPIRRLKGLVDESSKGKMHLEIIVEDTYFKPWEENFVVEEHTSIKVKIAEQKKPSKPILEVKVAGSKPKMSEIARNMLLVCEKVGINKSNAKKKAADLKQLFKEYFRANPELIKESKKYINETMDALR
jgi:hypothetical protein